MSARAQWRRALDAEMRKWSALSCDELIATLTEAKAYETEFESRIYQVEVQILEDTETYVHVALAIDDGVLPAAVIPAADSFICQKSPGNDRRRKPD